MKAFKYIMVIAVSTALFGCQKDPLSEITDGSWNRERNILNISFTGMIGNPTIERQGDNATIEFLYNANLGADFSAIKVTSLEVSFGAEASVAVGQTLDFNNADNTAVITVNPVNGEPFNWIVKLNPFTEPLDGNWNIAEMKILINIMGDFPEWGGTWDESNMSVYLTESSFEMDNVLSFVFEGFNEAGNSYGTFNNQVGADGKYGEFTRNEWGYDYNSKYRLLPKGSGTWEKNYSNSTIKFIDSEGKVTTATLINVIGGVNIRFEFADSIFWDNPWDWVAKIGQETKYFWYSIREEV